ncbi:MULTISPECIES: DUF6894 family protein [Methylobacterium]|uniref:DUF6894 family protein n=1 Tax=Methylobacterium TaxID=407 RepID=UPI000AC2AE3E|nr:MULTISPECIES: hypothetical protein [Methylobacterium]MCI9880227.1 hypothetical protein [Methylobacterium goesingense]
MLPHFFFDLTDGQSLLRDDLGIEVEDVDTAVEQALIVIDEMHADGSLTEAGADWDLNIRNQSGIILKKIKVT